MPVSRCGTPARSIPTQIDPGVRRSARARAERRTPGSICVGIDLAGVPHRETGIAILRAGRLELLKAASADDEILAFVARAGPTATVAVNAPLGLPRGRCCLDDDCGCRYDPGTRSRQIERELLRMRIPTLATALIKVLARRGIALAAALRAAGWEP